MDFNYHAREIGLSYCRASSGKRFADDVIDLIISTFFFLVLHLLGILLPGTLDGTNDLVNRLVVMVYDGL